MRDFNVSLSNMSDNPKRSKLSKITESAKPSDAQHVPATSGTSQHPTNVPLPEKPVPDEAGK